ncbi:MAG: HAD hydrolase-like protein [Treponema sp.]|nr:HAD hydrolase-like protein [Treponema sp.]
MDKNNIFIIGDSLSVDIDAGNNAGIDSCWFNKSGDINSADILPTYEIRKLNELNKHINRD